MTITREDVRRQLDLEEEARSLGAVRYRQSRPLPWRSSEVKGVEEEAALPPGQRLIKLAVAPTAERIRQFISDANGGKAGRKHSALGWFELAEPEEVAYLTARVALNGAVAQHGFQTTALKVAEAVMNHVDLVNFRGKNKAGYIGLMRSQYGVTKSSKNRRAAIKKLLENEQARTAISSSDRLLLGSLALELLVEATGLFSLELVHRGYGKKGYIIRASEAVEKWLDEQHARCELLEPMLMPMVVRPRRWRSPYSGGYLGGGTGKHRGPTARLIKSQTRDYDELLRTADLTKVYEAINHIQETPWRINRRVLDVMREVWDTGGSIVGLPPRDDSPLPARPHDIETNEEALKTWKREASLVHQANAANHARRLGVHQRLWIAEKFVDETAIWFPHSMDFRGRVYPLPATSIHPQSDDAGKALLEFAHGLPLGKTGAYWLAVHIANLFGVDKVSFEDRVKWTYDHSAQLIDSALEPLDGARFWTEADSPWMALAAAFEFAGSLSSGEAYVSRLPIPLDGSNSGLQHFSAMLRDPVGAAAVNLIPSPTPQDVYSAVASAAQARVDGDVDVGSLPWRGGKVTRKVAKRPTMTFVYSATRFGMQDMILQTLREIDAENANRGEPPHLGGADNYHSAMYLSHVLFEAVSAVVSAASGAMEWLRRVSKIAAAADMPVRWTTPDGLPILQAYRDVYGQRVKAHWQGQRVEVMLAVDGSRLDGRGQANGIAPNFVHSLDAAHLRAVARGAKAEGIDYLAVIHDSFGTHAANTDALVRILRDTFVEQYTPDVLGSFREEVAGQLPEELAEQLPPALKLGPLDLSEVKQSAYVFA